MNLPPLNQTLWALLIASLTAGASWGVVVLSSQIEKSRQKRHGDHYMEPRPYRPPHWYPVIRSWLGLGPER